MPSHRSLAPHNRDEHQYRNRFRQKAEEGRQSDWHSSRHAVILVIPPLSCATDRRVFSFDRMRPNEWSDLQMNGAELTDQLTSRQDSHRIPRRRPEGRRRHGSSLRKPAPR